MRAVCTLHSACVEGRQHDFKSHFLSRLLSALTHSVAERLRERGAWGAGMTWTRVPFLSGAASHESAGFKQCTQTVHWLPRVHQRAKCVLYTHTHTRASASGKA